MLKMKDHFIILKRELLGLGKGGVIVYWYRVSVQDHEKFWKRTVNIMNFNTPYIYFKMA